MNKRRKPGSKWKGSKGGKPGKGSGARGGRPLGTNKLTLKSLGAGAFALVPPRCAVDRQLDLEDVHGMIEEDELEMARDELLYLVEDCHGFLEAHNLLAEQALATNDVALARGHYGYAFENVLESLPPDFGGRLPQEEGYNPHFYAAGCGLVRCLVALKQNAEARDALKTLLRLDPGNADVQSLQDQLDEHERTPPASPLLPILPSE